MLATLEVLRQREGFSGYIHVKLLPGAEIAQVEAAQRLATRISVNLEGPTDAHVSTLAKEKNLTGDLLPKLELAGRLYREAREEGGPGPRGSTTTQFVVGAVGEKDQEVLRLVARLEGQRLLHHAHFSAFQPVAGTPFEDRAPTPAARESRLYQAEHLLREYGFGVEELAFETGGNLPLEHDPKTAWALAHPERFPLEVTRAPLELLLRVPGLGPKAARTLVQLRRRAVRARPRRSASDRRGHGAGGLLPDAARPTPGAAPGAAAATPLRARRSPHAGAVPHAGPALRV